MAHAATLVHPLKSTPGHVQQPCHCISACSAHLTHFLGLPWSTVAVRSYTVAALVTLVLSVETGLPRLVLASGPTCCRPHCGICERLRISCYLSCRPQTDPPPILYRIPHLPQLLSSTVAITPSSASVSLPLPSASHKGRTAGGEVDARERGRVWVGGTAGQECGVESCCESCAVRLVTFGSDAPFQPTQKWLACPDSQYSIWDSGAGFGVAGRTFVSRGRSNRGQPHPIVWSGEAPFPRYGP